MITVFFGISHNNTTPTELTCDKAFSYVQKNKKKGVVDFTSRPRQHGMRMSLLIKSSKIQCMQVFRPRIELQKFQSESNLSQVCLVFFRVSPEEFHHGMRMSLLIKSSKIQCMQVFRPRIELQKFRLESNLA